MAGRVTATTARVAPRSYGDDRSRLNALATPAHAHGSGLLAQPAGQIILEDQHVIVLPASGLALGALAPTDDRPAAGKRTGRQILETQDLFDDRALAVRGHVAGRGDDSVNSSFS
jgi:hypothetical protein